MPYIAIIIDELADQLIGRTVTVADILASINYLNGLGHNIGTTDDIDHLGNRRIRSVGELLPRWSISSVVPILWPRPFR